MLREPPRRMGCADRSGEGGMVRRMENCPEGEGTKTEEPEEWWVTGKALDSSEKIRMLVRRGRLARSMIRWSRPDGMRR